MVFVIVFISIAVSLAQLTITGEWETSWPELLPFLFNCTKQEDPGLKSAALYVLYCIAFADFTKASFPVAELLFG